MSYWRKENDFDGVEQWGPIGSEKKKKNNVLYGQEETVCAMGLKNSKATRG